MEGNLAQGSMIQGGDSFGGFDCSGSMRIHGQAQHPHTMNQHQTHPCQGGSKVHSSLRDGFLLPMGTLQSCDKSKNSASEEEEPSFTEDGGGDGHYHHHEEEGGMRKGSPWHRVKWTDKMVKLMITAVSYLGEDAPSDGGAGGKRKVAFLQKKGKWKSISKVMAERGHHVSPQQCEDKFNDLNKRYKRLNEMLGRGTSCQVVENPALLDFIDYLSEKEKDDVRKILSSKQLFYEEMCSYHNGNRLHLPHDPALQRSLHLALRIRDDHDHDHDHDDTKRSHHHDDHDEDDQDVETDDHDDCEENHASHEDRRGIYGALGGAMKKLKQGQGQEDVTIQALPERTRAALLQKQLVESRSFQLEKQKLQIQVEMLELEKQRFKWQKFSKKKDRELEKLKLENERMKLENERLALELKQKELED